MSNFVHPRIMPNFCHQKRIDKKYLISKLLSFWGPLAINVKRHHFYTRSVLFPNRQRDKIKGSSSRPAPPPPPWKRSILGHFFWSQKGAFFWLYLALKWSNFCHFFDISWNRPNPSLFVVRIPRHSDFLESFLRDILGSRIDKKCSFLNKHTGHDPV